MTGAHDARGMWSLWSETRLLFMSQSLSTIPPQRSIIEHNEANWIQSYNRKTQWKTAMWKKDDGHGRRMRRTNISTTAPRTLPTEPLRALVRALCIRTIQLSLVPLTPNPFDGVRSASETLSRDVSTNIYVLHCCDRDRLFSSKGDTI